MIDSIDSLFLLTVMTLYAALALWAGREIRRRREVG